MTTTPNAPTRATTQDATTQDEETDMHIDTVQDLLTAIERLPEDDRADARREVEAAIARPALEARAALGLLALDVVGQLADETAEVIVLPEFARPVVATA